MTDQINAPQDAGTNEQLTDNPSLLGLLLTLIRNILVTSGICDSADSEADVLFQLQVLACLLCFLCCTCTAIYFAWRVYGDRITEMFMNVDDETSFDDVDSAFESDQPKDQHLKRD